LTFYDRNGVVLADNLTNTQLTGIPERVTNFPKTKTNAFSGIIDINDSEWEELDDRLKEYRRPVSISYFKFN